MITEIDASLLEKIADLTGKPVGAFNIRKDMGCEARQSTEHIAIDPRADGKPGIDIHFKEGTKGETCHIPVIISQTGMSDMVYNDFYVADDCDVTIVAGCGIHNSGCDESRHDGIHTFHIGKNCRVRYTEKHYGEDAKGETGKNIMNPQTIVYLGENSTMQMDTIQMPRPDLPPTVLTVHPFGTPSTMGVVSWPGKRRSTNHSLYSRCAASSNNLICFWLFSIRLS